MSTDLITRLQQLAPSERSLEARWGAEDRADLARRIVSGDLRTRPRPARRLVAGASVAAAAAVAAAVALPALLPHDAPVSASPAAAEALHRLARVAADTPADVLHPGQLVHTVEDTHQVGIPGNPEDGPVRIDVRVETWTAYDGRQWIRHLSPPEQPWTFTENDPEGGVRALAALPTDVDALSRYLRRTVHGSSSKDEAVFVAVGSILASPTAAAELRAAAATVLARTTHVRLGPATRDETGRQVTELDFVDQSIRPGMVQALLVDPRTAQVVGSRTTEPGSTYGSTTLESTMVDAVPAEILRTAEPG